MAACWGRTKLVPSTPETSDPSETLAKSPSVDLGSIHSLIPNQEPDYPDQGGQQEDPPAQSKGKRKRNTNAAVSTLRSFLSLYLFIQTWQDQLNEWLKFRSAFLDEVLRHDGLGDFLGQTECSRCGKFEGFIKCRDCSDGRMLKCVECTLSTHQYLPLHRLEVRDAFKSPD